MAGSRRGHDTNYTILYTSRPGDIEPIRSAVSGVALTLSDGVRLVSL